MGLVVDDAKRADLQAIHRQGLAGVEANAGACRDQRVVGKARIDARVADHHQIGTADRVAAKRALTRCVCQVKTQPRLEPLTLAVSQAEQGNRTFGQRGGRVNQGVEARLGVGIEHTQLGQQ